MGLSFDYRPLSFGFTVTTPSLGIYGKGETVYNFTAVNIDTAGTGIGQSSMASNYQPELSSNYRSPLSIAVGATYYFRKSSLYFSLEWFNNINEFAVLQPENFIAQSSGNTISTQYEHELRSVTNYGFGFQHEFNEKLSVYASGIRDNSARITDSETPFSISNWDIYHVTLGSAFTFWRLDLTCGLTYSFGSEDFGETVIPAEVSSRILEEPLEPRKVNYRRIKLILGFTILSKPA
jgi:long-subunit fatty acid transport protein